MKKALDREQVAGLNRLLIAHGVTTQHKASTVCMMTDPKTKEMKIVRQTGWLAVSDEEYTPEVQEMVATYIKGLT